MQWHELRSHIRHLSAHDLKKIEVAFLLGKSVHEGQLRKSGEPYFNHPIAVTHMLIDLGADRDTIIAALLHDTVEDTPLTIQEIDAKFDGSVATLIDGLTKLNAEDVAMSPKLNEQIETLRKIFTLMQQDVRIMVIKLIDRLHNMQTIEFLPPEKQKNLAMETLEVYVKIAERLCMQDVRDELEGLCYSVLDPALHEEVLQLIEHNEQRATGIIADMKQALITYDPELAKKIELGFERKIWDQLITQTQMGDAIATGLSFISLTFVCEDIDMCYHVMGTLHQHWKREVLSFQDYINAPQLNGYRGLHTTVILQNGTRVRCKIRTKEMQTYARQGISSQCFDNKALGIRQYLPWVDRISSLTSDTKGSSTDFWENLKSDILGEFIIIHGPDDSTVQLPKDATALDAAFYLYQEHALRTKSIRMNGVDVLFGSPLVNAASIEVTLDPKETCSLDWLKQVKTGLATAKIREKLIHLSVDQKLVIGKELLQQEFSKHRTGFLEEFNLNVLLEKLIVAGYRFDNFDSIYTAIGEGKIATNQIYTALFHSAMENVREQKKSYIIQYHCSPENNVLSSITYIHEKYSVKFYKIFRSTDQKGPPIIVRLYGDFSETELTSFVDTLEKNGAKNIESKKRILSYWIPITLLLVLWGLDSIFAKYLLTSGFTAPSLTFIRSWTSFIAAFLIICSLQKNKYISPISLRNPLIWISGISFFLLSFVTYLTLEHTTPFLYKTALRFSSLILGLPLLISEKLYRRLIIACFFVGIGCTLLFFTTVSSQSLLLSSITVAAFTLYTWSSENFQLKEKIDMRYPQFFFIITGISAVASLLLPIFTSITFPSTYLLFLAIVFTLVFVCLPYILFYVLSRVTDYLTLAPLFHASIFITFITQWMILGINDLLIIPAAGLLIIGSLITSKRWNLRGS